jgi:hypothetical protein
VVGDVERIVIPGEAGGRGKQVSLKQGFADFGLAVAIGIAQQDQLVGRSAVRSGTLHQCFTDLRGQAPTHAAARRIGFGYQDVTIGQDVDYPGMLQSFGDARHFEPLGRLRRFSGDPADRTGDRDRGNFLGLRLRNHRIAAREFI